MLRISESQYEALSADALSAFEAAMVAHAAKFAPRHAARLGKDGLLAAIRAAVARAARHGFTNTGPVRLFFELGFLFGSGFDADVQHPWARACLGEPDPTTQMGRAMALHEKSIEALAIVGGPNNRYRDAALRSLQALLAAPPPLGAEDFSATVLADMARIHPRKYAHIEEGARQALIAAGLAEAASHGLSDPADVRLLILLMFVFGQGCASDPLHPWIGRALGDDRLASPSSRARKLEDEALAWIGEVLASEEAPS